jgi:hypothetical protein
MASKPQGLPPPDQQRLEALPQRFDIWQADARQAQATVRSGDRQVRPWMTVVVSRTEGTVLAFELTHERPTAGQVQEVLISAMEEPAAGEPHRPTEVRLRDPGWAAALRPSLEAIGIRCEAAEVLDQIDVVFDELAGQLGGQVAPGQGGLLDMPGVTPEAGASMFDAAALFFEQAPWKRTGERPIRVESDAFESGPWYAVVLGQGGMARGLVLYDDLETLLRIQGGNLTEEENARLSAGLALVFGDKEDLAPADAEAAERLGWRVAGPDAYPSAYRLEPGLSTRPPLAWEVRLLEGCLRALPEFARKKTRRLAPLSVPVPTAAGELTLILSWATA